MTSQNRDTETIKRDGAYNLPTDSHEGNRLDHQHLIFAETFSGRLFFSPLTSPTSILDLGCGTSAWGIDVAHQFPNARVTGLDLGHYPPAQSPKNYTFVSGNFERPWAEALQPADAKFDYIHARFVVVAMKAHKTVIAETFEHLQPGGWFELQELKVPLDKARPLMQKWGTLMQEASLKMGRNLGAALSWEGWLKDAGFANIGHEKFAWPLGAPPQGTDAEKKLGDMVLNKNILPGIEGISRINYTNPAGLGWDEDRFLAFMDELKKDSISNPGGNALTIHVIYGQKPMA